MKPYYERDGITLYLGDCIEVMRALPEASVDAVVTDPPYGLEFMGKEWDAPWKSAGDVVDDPASVGGFQDGNGGNPYSRARIRYGVGIGFQQWCEAWAREAYRVLKPGGHLAAFGGTRTHHRLVCGIEDAGFEIRDELDWMFGSGFPKSLDVSKAIDKLAGAEREVIGVGQYATRGRRTDNNVYGEATPSVNEVLTAPATEDAQRWQGWGTALKPAHEPVCLARKPLAGTVAQNVLRHGTGALNIDATRIAHGETIHAPKSDPSKRTGIVGEAWQAASDAESNAAAQAASIERTNTLGRWPANVILDEEAAALLDATVGRLHAGGTTRQGNGSIFGSADGEPESAQRAAFNDPGGPSRFFYTAKASRSEREAGLDDLPGLTPGEITDRKDGAAGTRNPRAGAGREQGDEWANEALRAVLQGDMETFLRRATDGSMSGAGSAWSMTLSGSESADLSQTDGKSTISTETSSTTESTTSSPSTLSRISGFIRDALSKMESGLSPAEYAASVSRLMQRIGISVERDGLSTEDAALVISESLYELSKKGGMPNRVVARRNDHPT